MRPAIYDLAEVIDRIGRPAVLRHLNVHRTTLLRWERGQVRIPTRTHHLLRELLGHLPGTDGQWSGWRFWKGRLFNPAGDSWSPGEVEARHWHLQLIDSLQRRVSELEAQVASMSVDPFVREKAANDMTAEVRRVQR